MKRLLYDNAKVLHLIRNLESVAKNLNMEYALEFIKYHNDVCPSCEKKMKIDHSNTVKNVGAIQVSVMTDMKLVIPFAVCKTCSKKSITHHKAESEIVDDYILGRLGLLDVSK